MKPTCGYCHAELQLGNYAAGEFVWSCGAGCPLVIRTGVSQPASVEQFTKDVMRGGNFDPATFLQPLAGPRLAAAKVYMAHILLHFIQCTWAGCYNSVYLRFLVPHLDSPHVLDYVLRSDLIHENAGVPYRDRRPEVFPELFFRLSGVQSEAIHEYLRRTFDAR